MLHTKFGTTTNAWSLIHAVFKDALSLYIFWVRSLQPFQQPSSPFLYCPLLLCIRNAFISFLLPHTMKGCYHVRTLCFLPLLPTTASTQLRFLFSGQSGKPESVLSETNPCSCKRNQAEAMPLLERYRQTSVTPPGSGNKYSSHLSSVLFSCWCFLLTRPGVCNL